MGEAAFEQGNEFFPAEFFDVKGVVALPAV